MDELDEVICQLRMCGAEVLTMVGVEVAERFNRYIAEPDDYAINLLRVQRGQHRG
jgi:hypothetical protein